MSDLMEFLRARLAKRHNRIVEAARRMRGPTFVTMPNGGHIVRYPDERLTEAIRRECKP